MPQTLDARLFSRVGIWVGCVSAVQRNASCQNCHASLATRCHRLGCTDLWTQDINFTGC